MGGAPEGYDATLLKRELARGGDALIHVARDDKRAEAMAQALAFAAPELTVLRFPAWDCLPFDRVSPNPDISAGAYGHAGGIGAWRSGAVHRAHDIVGGHAMCSRNSGRGGGRRFRQLSATGWMKAPCATGWLRMGFFASAHGVRTRRLCHTRRDFRHLPAGRIRPGAD